MLSGQTGFFAPHACSTPLPLKRTTPNRLIHCIHTAAKIRKTLVLTIYSISASRRTVLIKGQKNNKGTFINSQLFVEVYY
jgi:hypothetical protein